MAKVETRRWAAEPSGLTRRDRQPCDYQVYFPDPLANRRFTLDGETAGEVAAAEAALARLDAEAFALASTEGMARLLLRAESVASSRIEGLEVGSRRLLRTALALELGADPRDVNAVEILRNVEAMSWGTHAIGEGDDITVETLLSLHERLLAGSKLAEHGGAIRDQQNWIGGSGHNPCSAAFVPPPPESVRALLKDLCDFCNTDALPAIAQAAIAHAQFETIHPFVDGNGRTGRALIHLVLRRRGFARRVLPPISLILATWSQEYIARLMASRYRGPATSRLATEATGEWIAFFAGACSRAVEDALRFEREVAELQAGWLERLEHPRRDSAARLLVMALPAIPVLTATTAASAIGRSFPAASGAIERLAEAGILVQVNVGKRNRAYESPELIDHFTSLERRLASRVGDTRIAPPSRPVPRRRNA